jgi:hypothetical protein
MAILQILMNPNQFISETHTYFSVSKSLLLYENIDFVEFLAKKFL